MKNRLTFEQFNELLQSNQISDKQINDHLELDPDSENIDLRFRSGALFDNPPEDYRLNDEFIQWENRIDAEFRMHNFELLADKPIILMDGDSWYKMPFTGFLTPKEIGDWIKDSKLFQLYRDASKYGATIADVYREKEYLKYLPELEPHVFLISGGGNDLKNNIPDIIHDYDPALTPDQYLTQTGEHFFSEIKSIYEGIIAEANAAYLTNIIIFGYDYPRPDNRGKYIGKKLEKKNIPEPLMIPVTNAILDLHNNNLISVASQYENVTYLSCLGETTNFTWDDDLHPSSEGFEHLSKLFIAQIDDLLT